MALETIFLVSYAAFAVVLLASIAYLAWQVLNYVRVLRGQTPFHWPGSRPVEMTGGSEPDTPQSDSDRFQEDLMQMSAWDYNQRDVDPDKEGTKAAHAEPSN